MKKSIFMKSVLILSIAFSFITLSCSLPEAKTWGDPCTRIYGESINSISTLGDTPIDAGQAQYMKAKEGDYFLVKYKAIEGNLKVEIQHEDDVIYHESDLVGTLGNENQFMVEVPESRLYKSLIDVTNFLGFVTVEKVSNIKS